MWRNKTEYNQKDHCDNDIPQVGIHNDSVVAMFKEDIRKIENSENWSIDGSNSERSAI